MNQVGTFDDHQRDLRYIQRTGQDDKKKQIYVSRESIFLSCLNVCTIIGARINVSGIVFDPRVDFHEFGDEARYVTLDNSGVPP